MGSALKVLEQVVGALLMAFVLLDVFLTVLYARMRSSILGARMARGVWSGFRFIARETPLNRGKLLAFCGPLILVILVLMWGLGLTLGAALILHPHLGTSIKASNGQTETDFITAMFVAGSSIAVVGASDYQPDGGWFKMFYLFNSLVGVSVLSLTLTYLMQIYSALLRRNSVGLSIEIGTEKSGDAANFVAHLGHDGRFDMGYMTVTTLADSIAGLKEAHHFYPVLFYFRFEEPYYSVSRLTGVTLDAASIIRTALDRDQYRWFIESGAVTEIWDASLLLIITLQRVFLNDPVPKPALPEREVREQWRARFFEAVRILKAANVRVASDLEKAANDYIALRSQWSPHIRHLGPAMLYSMEEIDPVIARISSEGREQAAA